MNRDIEQLIMSYIFLCLWECETEEIIYYLEVVEEKDLSRNGKD